MANFYFRVNSSEIRRAVKQKVSDLIIALTKNPEIRYMIAEKGNELVESFVPSKSGALRESFHVVQHAGQTQLVWGSPSVGKTRRYAYYQHEADDYGWDRATPGTMSHWTSLLEPGGILFDELTDYAAEIMRREIRNGR